MLWFYEHHELFDLMDDKAAKAAAEAEPETDEEELEALQVVIFSASLSA